METSRQDCACRWTIPRKTILSSGEAATFWEELNMRQKVNAAVAEVRAEVQEGRLTWCYNDIRRLIWPYPRHQHVGGILAALGEDTALEDAEKPYEDAEQGSYARAHLTTRNGATQKATGHRAGALQLRRCQRARSPPWQATRSWRTRWL